MKRLFIITVVMLWAGVVPAWGHVEDYPSVHDTVSAILERMRTELPVEQLGSLSVSQVEAFLSPEERSALGTQYLTFTVDVPVVISVIRDISLGEEPFWLKERGFEPTDLEVQVDGRLFDVWQKAFPAGDIGLGCNSLSGGGRHYFVAIQPKSPNQSLAVTAVYPAFHTVGELTEGANAFADRTGIVESLPEELRGQTLLRAANNRRREAQLTSVFHVTPYPTPQTPDQIFLTWSDDPQTTQTIQWRTSVDVAEGVVAFQTKATYNSFTPTVPQIAKADTKRVETPFNVNDPAMHRHTVTLTDLEPGTTYVYAVGNDPSGPFTELAEFTTAPDGIQPFSFVYMGDAQNGLLRWETVVQNAYRERPDAAFYVMAGDLVNRGNERHEWDIFFEMAKGIYDRRPIVPALGNHEYQGGEPWLYLDLFTLPENGPEQLTPKKAYAFEYSNALFVVLDSNMPADSQTEWLEEQLATTSATWKFVVYHHPAYSSSPNRDNPSIRTLWGEIFDRYHVDMALQGHDHAYLRTYPMRDGQRVNSPSEGTIYIVSVAGTKFYEQGDHDYIERGLSNTSMYQVLDIQISGDRLVYRAYDLDGNLCDELVIEK